MIVVCGIFNVQEHWQYVLTEIADYGFPGVVRLNTMTYMDYDLAPLLYTEQILCKNFESPDGRSIVCTDGNLEDYSLLGFPVYYFLGTSYSGDEFPCIATKAMNIDQHYYNCMLHGMNYMASTPPVVYCQTAILHGGALNVVSMPNAQSVGYKRGYYKLTGRINSAANIQIPLNYNVDSRIGGYDMRLGRYVDGRENNIPVDANGFADYSDI